MRVQRKPGSPPPPARPNWRAANPGYVYSPPRRVKVNGVPCVELDGGSLADMAYTGERKGAR